MRRVSLVGALFSGAVVLSGGLIVLYHSLDFLWGQNGNSSLHTEGMALLAIFGVAANFIGAWRLSKGSTQNSKILTWHLIEDTLGWTAVLVGAIVIHFTQWYWLDPVLAIAITIYVSINVLRLSLETIKLFLQSTPIGFNKEALISEIKKIEHVLGVHEVHAWSLDGASNILSLHINVSDQVRASEEVKIKAQIRQCAARFGRFHSTIEIEHGHQECPDSCE
jgi:cobalt-zinc-cadmium efflux system protein